MIRFHVIFLIFIFENDPIQLIGSKFMDGSYGTKFETTNIESKITVGKYYHLYVSEVNSPYKFWFQLVDENNFTPLDDLQKQLK